MRVCEALKRGAAKQLGRPSDVRRMRPNLEDEGGSNRLFFPPCLVVNVEKNLKCLLVARTGTAS